MLLGRAGGVTHWLEDVAAGFAAEGCEIAFGITRRAWLAAGLESALAESTAARIVARIRRFQPDLILSIGGYHTPHPALAAIAALPGRPPLAGWVGDLFDETARALAGLYDAVAYTDSGLLARHRDLGFAGQALFLPHAVDPHGPRAPTSARRAGMVFVANPTPLRRTIVSGLDLPITLHGPAWRRDGPAAHDIHAGRTAKSALPAIYGAHLAALNIRNEINVLSGLNQRSFEPCLAGAVIVTDDQPDLARAFEPGAEVLVWRDVDELNALHARILRDPAAALAIAEAGRRRVLSDHTFGRRLAALRALV